MVEVSVWVRWVSTTWATSCEDGGVELSERETLRRLRDAAWNFKQMIYSAPSPGPESTIDRWLTRVTCNLRAQTPELQFEVARQRLLKAVAGANLVLAEAVGQAPEPSPDSPPSLVIDHEAEQHPEWCDRKGCRVAAVGAVKSMGTAVQLCRRHLAEELLAGKVQLPDP